MLKKITLIFILISIISCKTELSKENKQAYVLKGKEITKASFKELSSHLMEQMKLGGPQQAVPFCNVKAMPIISKMEDKFNVTIKRTSNKLRNSENKATERELEIINKYQALLDQGKELTPIVELNKNNQKHYFAPIQLNSKCLTCHGKLEEKLSVKTDSLIKSLYPNDKAIGYNEGDLRGIWSIVFKN
jgi:hypothetical protein